MCSFMICSREDLDPFFLLPEFNTHLSSAYNMPGIVLEEGVWMHKDIVSNLEGYSWSSALAHCTQ